MGERPKQILAMGGGGFSMEPDNLLLDEYILGMAGGERPRVCFLPTASGDGEGYIERFYAAFRTLPCEPVHLALTGGERPADLRGFVLGLDVVYVGGGHTMNMLAVWRGHGLDAILREAWNRGTVLAGLSAGSHCWFEEGLTDSIPGTLTRMDCLGFLEGSNCVHYDGEPERRPLYLQLVGSGAMRAGLAADDGVGLHFVGERLHRVVSSRRAALAYEVRANGEPATERAIPPEFLGTG